MRAAGPAADSSDDDAMPLQYSALRETVCLDVRGAEAEAFLHGQLTAALVALDPSDAPLAAWADARGRVRAIFRVCRYAERWLLVTPRAGVDDAVKKLRMFVLRSKVTVAVADDLAVAALLGAGPDALTRGGVPAHIEPNRAVRRDDLCFIGIGAAYSLVLGPPAPLAALGATLAEVAESAVALAEIRLGIPAIAPVTSERFVAQMLNLDALGALSFNKGCYPGQEIIARVHNLGGVKRRAHRYALRAPAPAAGSAVSSGGREVGEVVRAAPAAHGSELLAVVDHAAADAELTCGGAALVELPLPFTVSRR
jgi:folate-binding protein YgfZ